MGLTLCAAMAAAGVTLWLPAPAAEFDAFTRDVGEINYTGAGKPGQIGCIAFGFVRDQLSFVVFTPISPDGTETPCAVTDSTTNGFRPDGTSYLKSRKVLLDLPKGGSVRLPIRAQLIEVKDGTVRLSPRRVTLKELKAYLASDDAECSLDAMLRFVDAQRKKSK